MSTFLKERITNSRSLSFLSYVVITLLLIHDVEMDPLEVRYLFGLLPFREYNFKQGHKVSY